MHLEGVGNYALAPTWQDGHNTGIYSFRLLRGLCPCDGLRRREALASGRPSDLTEAERSRRSGRHARAARTACRTRLLEGARAAPRHGGAAMAPGLPRQGVGMRREVAARGRPRPPPKPAATDRPARSRPEGLEASLLGAGRGSANGRRVEDRVVEVLGRGEHRVLAPLARPAGHERVEGPGRARGPGSVWPGSRGRSRVKRPAGPGGRARCSTSTESTSRPRAAQATASSTTHVASGRRRSTRLGARCRAAGCAGDARRSSTLDVQHELVVAAGGAGRRRMPVALQLARAEPASSKRPRKRPGLRPSSRSSARRETPLAQGAALPRGHAGFTAALAGSRCTTTSTIGRMRRLHRLLDAVRHLVGRAQAQRRRPRARSGPRRRRPGCPACGSRAPAAPRARRRTTLAPRLRGEHGAVGQDVEGAQQDLHGLEGDDARR